jgi:hypothetical protein
MLEQVKIEEEAILLTQIYEAEKHGKASGAKLRAELSTFYKESGPKQTLAQVVSKLEGLNLFKGIQLLKIVGKTLEDKDEREIGMATGDLTDFIKKNA